MRFARSLLLVSLAALAVVPAALSLAFSDESFFTPDGEVGKPYFHKFDGRGGCGPDPAIPDSGLPYQYRILAGELPAGLSLSKDGKITGTPTAPGTASFWVELSDEDPPSQSWCQVKKSERQFTIRIVPALVVQQKSLSPSFVNEVYTQQLTAEGGGTHTWSLQSGVLPTGMTLSPTGLLSGTPTAVGDFSFVVKVADTPRSSTQALTLTVVQRLAATQAIPAAEVGVRFTGSIAATGGKAPYAFAVTTGALPEGLAIDPTTGAIAGMPLAAGRAAIVVTVTDALGLTLAQPAVIAVAERLALSTKLLRAAKEGKAYLFRIRTIGGVAPTAWQLQGKLPKGLRFNARTATLVGKPKQDGTFRLVFTATDSLGVKAKTALRLIVRPTA